jgi:hypothetical protein
MTRKRNYFKICGSKEFIDAALKVITPKFQVVFQTDLKESDTVADIYFLYINIADRFLEVV